MVSFPYYSQFRIPKDMGSVYGSHLPYEGLPQITDLTKKRSRFLRKVPKVDILKIDVDSYDCALMQAILAKARKKNPHLSHGKFVPAEKKGYMLVPRRVSLGGGFKYFYVQPLFGEDTHFD